jgi:hypothetical protein
MRACSPLTLLGLERVHRGRSGVGSLLLLLALVFVGLSPSAARAEPVRSGNEVKVVRAHVDDVGPTQMEIGYAEAREKLDKWEKKARKAFPDLPSDVALKRFAKDLLSQEPPVPGVIDPEGRVLITDGHHRVWALQQLEQRTGLHLDISVNVEKDYRGYSTAEFARDFIEGRGKGLFTRDVRSLPVTERMAHLPRNFAALADNPTRAAVGVALRRAGISGTNLHDYGQFYLAEGLLDRGLLDELKTRAIIPKDVATLPPEQALDDRLLDVVGRMIFRDRDGLAALRSLANPQSKDTVEAAIANASAPIKINAPSATLSARAKLDEPPALPLHPSPQASPQAMTEGSSRTFAPASAERAPLRLPIPRTPVPLLPRVPPR